MVCQWRMSSNDELPCLMSGLRESLLMSATASFFTLVVSGQIQAASLPEYDNLYCKYAFEAGPDFVLLEGVEEGISQFAKGVTSTWNFPLDIACTPVSSREIDELLWMATIACECVWIRRVRKRCGAWVRKHADPDNCREVYLTNDSHTEYVPLFVPVATSPFNTFYAWLTGSSSLQRPIAGVSGFQVCSKE